MQFLPYDFHGECRFSKESIAMSWHRINLVILLHVHLLDNCNGLTCGKRTMELSNVAPFEIKPTQILHFFWISDEILLNKGTSYCLNETEFRKSTMERISLLPKTRDYSNKVLRKRQNFYYHREQFYVSDSMINPIRGKMHIDCSGFNILVS